MITFSIVMILSGSPSWSEHSVSHSSKLLSTVLLKLGTVALTLLGFFDIATKLKISNVVRDAVPLSLRSLLGIY